MVLQSFYIRIYHCHPVISVDGTFLKGDYKDVLLISSSWDANNHVYPLVFAIVDEETYVSWTWFLCLLRSYVVPDRFICLISDRHKEILTVVNCIIEWQPTHVVYSFGLRHIKENFKVTFKKK